MLVLFPLTGITTSSCKPPFYIDYAKMALPLAHSHGHQFCNATELCMFIGYINYYCTCCRVGHISLNRIDLQFNNLIHEQTKCGKHLYNVFAYGYKSIACPDHNECFSIHTNASDFQLGTCIIQEGRPFVYFFCNLTMSQQSYTALEQ